MKYLKFAILSVLLVQAALICWMSMPNPGPGNRQKPPVRQPAPAEVETPVPDVTPAETEVPQTPRIATDAVTAARAFNPSEPAPFERKYATLAAAEELPAGPEAGPNLSPVIVLENVRAVFRQYHSRFGGNPVGSNPEITAALNGGNPRQVVFLNPEDGLRVNGNGQMIDNWNTPFFFHQLSRTEMEIHSAGPDRRMWTSDDLVIR